MTDETNGAPDEGKPEEGGEDESNSSSSTIEKLNEATRKLSEATEKLDKATAARDKSIAREEQLIISRQLGGSSEAGQIPEKKEETAAEYADRIQRGELKDGEGKK